MKSKSRKSTRPGKSTNSVKANSVNTLLVIGLGNMGSALVHGLDNSPVKSSLRLRLFDHKPELLEPYEGASNVEILSTLKATDAATADVVILCTKPQDLPSVARLIAGRLKPSSLVISILAAVTTDDLARSLKFKGAIVRAMPNIAATVGEAATAMCPNSHCDTHQLDIAHQIFTSFGTASWTKESLMDAVTGLSGSGPAYIYMVIEALTDGGVKMGMPRPLALELATQTVLGSAQLVQTTGLHPAILRDQVTTPGGTTISAIHELEERGLRAMLISAVATATEKSKSLRQ